MPITIETSEGPLVVLEDHLRAIARHAERQAMLTAAALDATGLFPERPITLPAGYLRELAAVLELGMWERQGLRAHLDVDLPSFHEAAAELHDRAKQGPAAFDETPLTHRVLRVWIENFAWEGPQIMGCDVLAGRVDEDEFAAVLAEFLLDHQHELSSLLPEPTE